MLRQLLYLVSCVLVLSLIGNVFAQEPEWDFYIPYAFEPPILDGHGEATDEHQRESAAVALVVESDSVGGGVGHGEAGDLGRATRAVG